MAHRTLINGTAYEIAGGKTLVGGTAYSIDKGKTLVGGTAYEVGFASWPEDLDTGLEFASASPFTVSVTAKKWGGAIEYCNGGDWQTWDGSEISSGNSEKGYCIYLRGTGNTVLTAVEKGSVVGNLTLSGTGINCNGNIEKLLDYATVAAGSHPTMGSNCYYGLFKGCTALTSAPSLPATTLVSSCYYSMFSGCTALTSAPSLPATTLAYSCYSDMFNGCTALTSMPSLPATKLEQICYRRMFSGCTKIKLSSTQTGTYTKAYRIPYSGTGTGSTSTGSTGGVYNMFSNTGGTFTGTPSVNTTYYLDSSNTIV